MSALTPATNAEPPGEVEILETADTGQGEPCGECDVRGDVVWLRWSAVRWIIFAIGISTAVVWFRSPIVRLVHVNSSPESTGLDPTAVLVFLGAAVLGMSLFIPKTVISFVTGATFGFWFGSGLMCLIALAAATLNFAIGRYFFDTQTILKRLRRSEHAAIHARLVESVSHFGLATHLIFRLAPVPTTIISYAMGSVRARFGPFLVAALLGVIPQWFWVHAGATTVQLSRAGVGRAGVDGAGVGGDGATLARVAGLSVSVLAAIALSVMFSRYATRRLRESPTGT